MKDPAVLFYVSDWLTSTAEMDSDVRGWYLNLILHNYDKKSLPNDIETLAVLAGVRFSEFKRFEHVFEHVFKQKFEQDENGRLSNRKTDTILRARENFKDERSKAGKVSYIMRYMAKNFTKEYKNKELRDFTKVNFDLNTDLKNEQVFKQVFKQVFELYRNENENESIDRDIVIFNNKDNENFESENTFEDWWNLYDKKVDLKKCRSKWKKLTREQKDKCFDHTPKYVSATPDKQFRRLPATYLNNENWNDAELLEQKKPTKPKDDGRVSTSDYFDNLRRGFDDPENKSLE